MTRVPGEAAQRAYVGLGSNLQDPVDQVTRALDALDRIEATRCLRRSALYLTRPVGPSDQPDYINAAALLETGLPPETLLDALQGIERGQGRVRAGERWGPRTLDLDLLLYGELCIATGRLSLPHPGLHLRAFVLYPLAEIAPDLIIPGRGPVRALRDVLGPDGVAHLG